MDESFLFLSLFFFFPWYLLTYLLTYFTLWFRCPGSPGFPCSPDHFMDALSTLFRH